VCAGRGMRLAEEPEIAARKLMDRDGIDSHTPCISLCHSVSTSRVDGKLNLRGTSMAVKLTSVFFVLFLLTGVAFPQAPNEREGTKTISVHIDGFMKSKSGSV
jgi:hypothetical protein